MTMNRRLKKILLWLLAGALLFGAGRTQQALNRDRATLGLTRAEVLDNAPPALVFTTVALGGFRGLISNFLWMRANDLQQDDKFFEAAQIADWITKLEPTYAQVWQFQAWNMAYNISVKFKENAPGDFHDRWNWLEHGIDLLRDDGLRYNPNNVAIFRELGWLFQHKIGQNLDDGNQYYKAKWAIEMEPFFGVEGTNFDRLLHPRTAADFQQLSVFTNRYKLDPAFAKSVDEQYGPLDWRLPEAHAIYWGAKGLDEAARNPNKVNANDLITLRRLIYQSLMQSFQHGRVLSNPFEKREPLDPRTLRLPLGPNLDLVAQANKAYLGFYADEPQQGQRDGILQGHRNFLRDAIYFLYADNRMGEAQKWFKYLGEKYPDKPIIENRPDSLPKTLTLDEYAVAVLQIDANETSQDRVTMAIGGFLMQSYISLASGQEDRYENLQRLASRAHEKYEATMHGVERTALMPLNDMKSAILRRLVDARSGWPYAARAALVSRLGLPASLLTEAKPDNESTNAPAATLVAPPATNAVLPTP